MSRSVKLLLIFLVPLAVYGAAKGLLYYKAKSTVDDFIMAASNHADIRYADITTDLRGAVTVSRITVQPRDYNDTIGIDSVRISSDDPMFFIDGAQWEPGRSAPPSRLAFAVTGIEMPVAGDMVGVLVPETQVAAEPAGAATPAAAITGPCAKGLNITPALLQQIGFATINMDVNGFYRIDETNRELEVGLDYDMRDIQSMRLDATFADVDLATLAAGGAPQMSLGSMGVAMRVDPAFGRQALKTCAIGTDLSIQAWSEHLAEQALRNMSLAGLELGAGLRDVVRTFYRDWGEFSLQARPGKPVGLLSLMFLPPEQLAPVLGLRMSLNDRPIVDTDFLWQRPDARGLSALFGGEEEQQQASAKPAAPARIMVRREYENMPVGRISAHVDKRVKIKPRGQPLREGVLKRIVNGEAEVEQTLHGGKFTVFVPVSQIESMQVLMQYPIQPGQ